MMVKVGINGFGRIGRVISRVCLQNPDLELTAINDPAISVEYISYLIKFDSTHGKLEGNVSHTSAEIQIDDKHIKVFHEKLPQSVPWDTAGVQYVVEASGMFTTRDKASGHLASNGVKRVIVTAPSMDVPMIILGVNDNKLKIEHKVMSCASSTLYCLAPIIKVLEDQFGVTEGFITSIHAMTPSLKPLDGLCLKGKHWRDHRSIHQNIIPASTGACKALGKIMPQMKDKLTGLAFRVPIVNVSVLDLTVRLNRNTTLADIAKSVDKASKTYLQNVIRISSEQSVSSDFIGEKHSCIYDEDTSIQLKPNFYKLICWYENEYSYACRAADSILFSEKQFSHIELPSKLANRPRSFKKQDVMQQTDLYKKEISVSCDSPIEYKCKMASGSQEKEQLTKSGSFIKKQFVTETTSQPSSKRRNDIFQIWNDTKEIPKPIAKQNRSAFFKSWTGTASPVLKPSQKAQASLQNVKREFSKMVNITEDLLKKTHSNQTDTQSISKNEFIIKSDNQFRTKDRFFIADTEKYKLQRNDKVENCGDCLSSKNTNEILNDSSNEEEISHYSYDNEILDLKSSKKTDNVKMTPSVNISKVLDTNQKIRSENTFNNNVSAGSQKDDFKKQLTKTINTLVEGLNQNTKVQSLINNQEIIVNNKGKIVFKDTNIVNCNDVIEDETSVSKECAPDKKYTKCTKSAPFNIDSLKNLNEKVSLYEKYKTNNDNMNVKQIDKQLRKRNIVLVDNSFVSETTCDDNSLIVENIEPRINANYENILTDVGLKTNTEAIVIVSDNSRCDSPENTNTTISNRIENKQDLYDKLDSASATDSDDSFEINGRKSQVINITDLTNSFEDLARLDKICRIIEISDELSDKLFSALDDKHVDLKKKRWSFRDLCERIHLDEFCNKVFGNTV